MSTAIDTNVLLCASDEASIYHARARELLEELAEGPDLLYLFWPVLMGYLRIATHPSIFENPLPPESAIRNVEGLVRRPHVRTPGEDDGFWDLYTSVNAGLVVRGNLVSDAHLAALMRQYGVTRISTHDRDFRRFEGLTVDDPFA